MNKVKAVIIDDEELARQLIKNYLKEETGIEIISECENGFEGVKAITDLNPDLVFLDIQMPKLNGFEMLELIDQPPEVIFITAHNEYAIKAFEKNAVDYLMKPYSKQRLLEALHKAIQRISTGNISREKIQQLIHHPLNDFMERIVVKSGNKIKVILASRILYLEAEDDYVMIHTEEGKHLKKGTMKYFEEHLDPSEFVRVHRSYIVRVDQVTQIEPYSKENYSLKLKNNAQIRISRSGYKNIREKFRF